MATYEITQPPHGRQCDTDWCGQIAAVLVTGFRHSQFCVGLDISRENPLGHGEILLCLPATLTRLATVGRINPRGK